MLADRVEHIEHLVRQLVAVEPVAHHVRDRDVVGIVTGGLDRHFDLGHRALASAEHAKIMEVAFLDLLRQLQIGERIALVSGAQDVAQPHRRQAIGRIAGLGLADTGRVGAATSRVRTSRRSGIP